MAREYTFDQINNHRQTSSSASQNYLIYVFFMYMSVLENSLYQSDCLVEDWLTHFGPFSLCNAIFEGFLID